MFHSIKRTGLLLVLMLAGAQSIFGFALLGPFNESYQVPNIGYHLVPPSSDFGWDEGGSVDIGAPKNFRQGYRWNVPVVYYSYTPEFYNYFGTTGETNVDAAFQEFTVLTNIADLNLNQWPNYNDMRANYQASQLSLLDLKSYTMSMIIEQLGLAQPDRWTWCLHTRFTGGLTCPDFAYSIIQRNYNPTNYVYSSYVNDVFYDYFIAELCTLSSNPFAPLLADAIEIVVDPATQQDAQTAVAAFGCAFNYGTFYLSFSRDDIGGLQCLYSPTNVYSEVAETNSLMIVTNTSNPVMLVTSNLALFEQEALTNPPATLETLYPGLIIVSTTNWWTNLVTTNISAYLTNPPFATAGTFEVVLFTNYTTNVEMLYYNTYANLEIVHAYSKGFVTVQTVQTEPVPFGTPGLTQVVTNTTTTLQNFTNGDFYILPTNLCGPYQILSTQFVQVVATTNIIPIATNLSTIFTNTAITITNTPAILITYSTNYYLIAYEVDCETNVISMREGMNSVRFIRQDDYDAVADRYQTPKTNIYQLTAVSNGSPVIQTFQRIVRRPDIILDAADLAVGPAGTPTSAAASRTAPNFNTSLVPPGDGGPGTIDPVGIRFTYNNVGLIYFNFSSSFLWGGVPAFSQTNSSFFFLWGSFDGTTNTPVVYPDTASIASIEASLFYQITTANLPNASVSANNSNNPYSYSLSTAGNLVAPLSWSLASNSADLPPGMTLSASGVISGSPTTRGIYDFTVQVTDANGKVAQKSLSLEVDP